MLGVSRSGWKKPDMVVNTKCVIHDACGTLVELFSSIYLFYVILLQEQLLEKLFLRLVLELFLTTEDKNTYFFGISTKNLQQNAAQCFS